jgi:hypothetical protein
METAAEAYDLDLSAADDALMMGRIWWRSRVMLKV